MNPISALRLPVMPDALRGISPDLARPTIPVYELGKSAAAAGVQSGGMSPVAASFESTLGKLVAEVSGKQAAATNAAAGVLGNQGVPLHQAVLAAEEASVSFQLMVEVRNKLLESYQELMRMQV